MLIAMKVRVAWYAAANWAVSEDLRQLAGMVLMIDRFAFWASVVSGSIALIYIGCLRVPAVLQAEYCKQSRRAAFLCAAAAFSLAVSVVSDGVLTALALTAQSREAAIIPLASMAAEIGCIGTVIFLIVEVIRRGGHTSALLRA